MVRKLAQISVVVLMIAATGLNPVAPSAAGQAVPAAALQSIGPLAFVPNEVLFAADTQGATIYAFELGTAADRGAAGTKDVPGIDQKIAALLGTDAAAVTITDLAVHPRTKNSFIAVMRGQGVDA